MVVVGACATSAFACSDPVAHVRKDDLSTGANVTTVSVAPPTPNLSPPPQVSTSYAPDAAFVLHAALERAAGKLERGEVEAAAAELESEDLAKRTGVVVERYVAYRVEGRGPLSSSDAARVTGGLFDATYAIGRPGRRGVRIGQVLPGAGARGGFEREGDWRAFQSTRVISLMETWIRVWQDMVGVKPISDQTRAYLAAAKTSRGWSDVDVLATLLDLGVAVPEAQVQNARFPGWAAYARWQRARATPSPG